MSKELEGKRVNSYSKQKTATVLSSTAHHFCPTCCTISLHRNLHCSRSCALFHKRISSCKDKQRLKNWLLVKKKNIYLYLQLFSKSQKEKSAIFKRNCRQNVFVFRLKEEGFGFYSVLVFIGKNFPHFPSGDNGHGHYDWLIY